MPRRTWPDKPARARSRSRLLAFASLAAVALSVSACDNKKPAAPTTVSVVDAAVAAVVDGQSIYASDVLLEAEAQGIIKAGDKLEPDSAEFNRVLDGLIDQRLLAHEAELRKLDEEPQAKHRLQSARDRIMGNVLMESVVASRVDEAAIRKMYDAQVALFQLGEETHLRQIVTAKREEVEAIAKQIAQGADFVVLASDKSIDKATRLEGGDLGWMTPDEAPPELARIIRSTPVGGLSKPFETEGGWCIVKVEDRRKEQPPTLEQLRKPILDHLTYLQIESTLKDLRKKAKIQRLTEATSPAIEVDPFQLAPVEKDTPDKDPKDSKDAKKAPALKGGAAAHPIGHPAAPAATIAGAAGAPPPAAAAAGPAAKTPTKAPAASPPAAPSVASAGATAAPAAPAVQTKPPGR